MYGHIHIGGVLTWSGFRIDVGVAISHCTYIHTYIQTQPLRVTTHPTKSGHYSDLARTIGEEKREKTTAHPTGNRVATGTLPEPPPQPPLNPYIASFVEDMSQEKKPEAKSEAGGGKQGIELMDTSTSHHPPSRGSQLSSQAHHSPSQGTEGTAAKRPRVTGHAPEPPPSPQKVEGVRKDLEAMKIATLTADNPYVEQLAKVLLECYTRKKRESQKYSSSPNLSESTTFNNQYIACYQQSQQKAKCGCPSQPNRYIVQLERRWAGDFSTTLCIFISLSLSLSLSLCSLSENHAPTSVHQKTAPQVNEVNIL